MTVNLNSHWSDLVLVSKAKIITLIPHASHIFSYLFSSDISLSGFPMPNISEFLELEKPKTNYSKQTSIPKITDIILPMNQWNYQYENKPVVGGNQNRKEPSRSKVKGRDIISWKSLLATLVVIDLIWFIHRMARSYSTAKMILYGCPAYIDCRRAGGSQRESTLCQSLVFAGKSADQPL